MPINASIFREYDIRGIVDVDLTLDVVATLGRAMGTYFLNFGKKAVALGRDCRLSSPAFAEAMASGLRAVGCDVTDLGTVPTPLLYFAAYYKDMEAGVMITGSHNPPEYNGFKMMVGHETLYGDSIQEIHRIIREGAFAPPGKGTYAAYDLVPEYMDYVLKLIKLARPLKVVLDAGNGTAGVIAAPLFRKLGCKVDELFCDMDGRFPNHHPDPTLPEAMTALIDRVKETKAELGLAYDGDGDRIGVVDDEGHLIWGDQLLIFFARDILKDFPGAAVISEVKATQVLYDEIARLGGKPVMWKTGHSLIKKKIKEEGAKVAGEMSGHMFFADRWFGFDDAIYASLRVAELMARSPKRLSEMLAALPKMYSTPEIRVYASEEVKFKIVDEVKKELSAKYPVIDIDGVRAVMPGGWGLVRASNTQAVLVLRFEAETEERLAAIQQEVKGEVERAIQKLERT
ncbi:MAG: phosphomannomutase/phosphoglucomutase [Candidatus Aminicenantes bacterium]|nr:phosphomannomutase/phosphoglucomutase [Candidatus Aminicenantes bacterium]